MSIEKDLGRIADAVERIAEVICNPLKEVSAKAAAPAADLIPGMETETAVVDEGAMTPAGLRELAQKYIQVAGDKTGALVNFIKDGVCKKLSPTEPKLVKIPVDKVAEAAKLIEGFCKKNKIELPIEV